MVLIKRAEYAVNYVKFIYTFNKCTTLVICVHIYGIFFYEHDGNCFFHGRSY